MVLLAVFLYFIMISGVGMSVVRKLEIDDSFARLAASWVIGSSIIGLVMFLVVEMDFVYPHYVLFLIVIFLLLTLWNTKHLLQSMKDLIILPYSGGACKPTSGIASTIS